MPVAAWLAADHQDSALFHRPTAGRGSSSSNCRARPRINAASAVRAGKTQHKHGDMQQHIAIEHRAPLKVQRRQNTPKVSALAALKRRSIVPMRQRQSAADGGGRFNLMLIDRHNPAPRWRKFWPATRIAH
jgi:hypothetical protein